MTIGGFSTIPLRTHHGPEFTHMTHAGSDAFTGSTRLSGMLVRVGCRFEYEHTGLDTIAVAGAAPFQLGQRIVTEIWGPPAQPGSTLTPTETRATDSCCHQDVRFCATTPVWRFPELR